MNRMKALLVATVATTLFVGAPPAFASRTSDLVALSTVFGELHHVRRMCAPGRERDLWRERMKQLVALEQPTARLRRRLVEGFNAGYQSAQGRFAACTADAELFSIDRASTGETIVNRLSGAPHR